MQFIKVWYISSSQKFPLSMRKVNEIEIEIIEMDMEEFSINSLEADTKNIFLFQPDEAHITTVFETLEQLEKVSSDTPKIIILSEDLIKIVGKKFDPFKQSYLVDDSIRLRNLRLMVKFLVEEEYNRYIVYELYSNYKQEARVMERVLEFSGTELRDSKDTSEAYDSLMEYHTAIKKFETQFHHAMDNVNNLRDKEQVMLQEQLVATDQLRTYQEKELASAQATIQATEKFMEFSREEHIRRDELIEAMDKLRSLTDKELMELFEENQTLRKKLGMPPR